MAKKKTKAFTKTKDKELVWAGAKRLLSKPTTPKEEQERNLILLAAKVLGVSPFGVNILGTIPYINKLGREQKASEYQQNVKYLYNWIRHSENDEDKAICQCKLVVGSKELCDWITGECSPATTKMGTLKGYQNHLSQTRAKNRAIQEVFGVRIHKDMMRNIQKLAQKKEITTQQASMIGSADKTSIEEIQPEEKGKRQVAMLPGKRGKELFASDTDKVKIAGYSKDLGWNEKDDLSKFVSKTTGLKVEFKNMTKTQATTIIANLLQKQVALKK